LPPNLAIAGTGLIGASIGLRARAKGYRVAGWDSDPAHLATALARGALDAAVADIDALVAGAETIVLALPLPATLEIVKSFVERPPAAALILDVASVKTPVALAGAGLPAFVPTHPIAGSERSGPEHASAGLFEDRVWTVDPAAAPAALLLAGAFILAMGARPVPVPSEAHDRIAALTSHLPQLLAVALGSHAAERLHDEDVLALCGTGIRSMLRLGGSSWPMWAGIFQANAATLAQEVRALSAILSGVADALEAGHADALEPRFAAAATAIDRLNANAAKPGHVDMESPPPASQR
jgi:prephenate dehydrogenase